MRHDMAGIFHDTWSEAGRAVWPQSTPGFMFLGQAVDLLGKFMFPGDWALADNLAQPGYAPVPPPSNSSRPLFPGGRSLDTTQSAPVSAAEARRRRDQYDAEQAERYARSAAEFEVATQAMRRAYTVRQAIIAEVIAKRLPTYHQSQDTGALLPIPTASWTLIEAYGYFARCRIPPARWGMGHDVKQVEPIFVSEDKLRRIDWAAAQPRTAPEPLRAPVTTEPAKSVPAGSKVEQPAAIATDRTGLPGRPTAKHLIEADLKARAAAGQTLPLIKTEAAELLARFEANPHNAGLARPKVGTVENHIRSTYRQLHLNKTHENN